MYCPQCGNANEDNAAFCTKCGMDLQKYRDQWSTSPGDPAQGFAVAAATGDASGAPGAGAGQGTDPGQSGAGQPAGAGQSGGAPSTYPPPYQQQYQPTYQTPPYQPTPYQGGPGYQSAPYQPAGYQPAYPSGIIPNIPSYMAWAIVTLILCFWPTGIVAVVYASKVGNRLVVGDVPGAQDASRKAKMWCWITFGVAVFFWVIAIIGIVVAAATAVRTVTT